MNETVLPNQFSKDSKRIQVQEMFDDIAPNYDAINRVLSLRIDVLWRKKVINILKKKQVNTILDIATGTADLAIALSKLHPKEIIGIDISPKMLEVGKNKINEKNLTSLITLQEADSENLPFENNRFDAATVAFGVRNFEHLEKGLSEIHRVLKPEATFIILEFSKVKKSPWKEIFNFYFRYITPSIGKAMSKNKNAYAYLPNSVAAFPEGNDMLDILKKIGFKNNICQELSFGIASIYQCQK